MSVAGIAPQLSALLGQSSGGGTSALIDALVTPTASSGTSLFGPASILDIGGDATFAALSGTISAAYAFVNSAAATPVKASKQESIALNRAFDLFEAGKLVEARDALNRILDDNPRSGPAVQALGLIAMAENDTASAEQHFRRAHFLSPNRGYDTDAENAGILQQSDDKVLDRAAQLVSTNEQRDKGIELLLRLMDRSPGNAEAQLLLGESLIASKRTTEGVTRILTAIDTGDDGLVARIKAKFEKLVKAVPGLPEYRGVLARTRIRSGDFEAALADLDIADSLTDGGDYFAVDRSAALVGIGKGQLKSGDVTRAINTLREARRIDTTNPLAGAALAEALLAKANRIRNTGNLGNAILAYDEAARVIGAGGDASLRGRIASRAFTAGQRLEARNAAQGREIGKEVVAYQAAYTLDPDNAVYKRKLADTRNAIGDQYMADGKYASAAAAFERAYQLYKGDANYKGNLINAWRLRGDELLAQGRHDQAIDVYKKAYRVDQNDAVSRQSLATAYNARGLHLQARNRFGEAVRDFKEAVHLFPDNADYQANYAALSSYDR